MSKRANGDGSIYKPSDGKWTGALSYTDDAGQPRRCIVYGRTRTEVRRKLTEARQRVDA